jgi:hypothetical protein
MGGHSTDSCCWHSTCILSVCPWLSKPLTTPERRKQQTLAIGICRSGPAFCSPFFGGGFMNRLRFGFLGLGLLLAVSAAQAQETRVKANIPFDFVVGNQVLRPSVLRTKQSWSSTPWLAAISCPRSGCKATTEVGSSRSPAPKSNWQRITIRRRSSSSRPRSPAEASGRPISDIARLRPSPRGKKAWSNAERNAWTVPSFFFLHLYSAVGTPLLPTPK